MTAPVRTFWAALWVTSPDPDDSYVRVPSCRPAVEAGP